MKTRAAALGFALALAAAGAGVAQPASRPSSRPAANNRVPQAGPAARFLQSYKDVLDALDLTPEQKTKTDAALKDVGEKLRTLLPELQSAGPQERREKMMDVLADANKKIAEALTDEQKPKFREEMQEAMKQFRPAAGGAGGGARGKGRGKGEEAAPPPAPKPATPEKPASELKVGDTPPDLTLNKLDGNPVKIGSFKGKPLVLIFASYTVPTFREKAAKLNELFRDYHARNVDFLLIYTAEAFPAGDKEIDRNKKEKIDLQQHKTVADRQAAAKLAQGVLKLNMSIAIDDMSDSVAKAYGLLPNGAVIIGKDGKIAAIQRWEDPFALRAALDELQKVNVP